MFFDFGFHVTNHISLQKELSMQLRHCQNHNSESHFYELWDFKVLRHLAFTHTFFCSPGCHRQCCAHYPIKRMTLGQCICPLLYKGICKTYGVIRSETCGHRSHCWSSRYVLPLAKALHLFSGITCVLYAFNWLWIPSITTIFTCKIKSHCILQHLTAGSMPAILKLIIWWYYILMLTSHSHMTQTYHMPNTRVTSVVMWS
jgi:hypothetical protein